MSVLQNGNNVIFKLFVIFALWEDKVSCENVNHRGKKLNRCHVLMLKLSLFSIWSMFLARNWAAASFSIKKTIAIVFKKALCTREKELFSSETQDKPWPDVIKIRITGNDSCPSINTFLRLFRKDSVSPYYHNLAKTNKKVDPIICRINQLKLNLVGYTCNPSTWKVEEGRFGRQNTRKALKTG